MVAASRGKKIKFMNSFGRHALADAIAEAVRRMGADFLTDEQLDEIVSDQVVNARAMNRHTIRNRNAIKAERAA